MLTRRSFSFLERAFIFASKRFFSVTDIPPTRDQILEPYRQNIIDMTAQKFRHHVWDKPLLERKKLILPAVRLRETADTLESLRKNKLVAGMPLFVYEIHILLGVILGREEFQDVDLVFEARQIKSIHRQKDWHVRPYYIQINGELIRVVLDEIHRHHSKSWFSLWITNWVDIAEPWVINAQFRRFIVGRPNKLTVPLELLPSEKNEELNIGRKIFRKMEELDIICYNDDYPSMIHLDPAHLTTDNPIRLGHIHNMLPEGIFLHPKYKGQFNSIILHFGITIEEEMEEQEAVMKELEEKEAARKGEATTKEAAASLEPWDTPDEKAMIDEAMEDEADNLMEDEPISKEQEEETLARIAKLSGVKEAAPKQKKEKKRKTKNLKKIVATMQGQLKQQFGIEDEKKKPAQRK